VRYERAAPGSSSSRAAARAARPDTADKPARARGPLSSSAKLTYTRGNTTCSGGPAPAMASVSNVGHSLKVVLLLGAASRVVEQTVPVRRGMSLHDFISQAIQQWREPLMQGLRDCLRRPGDAKKVAIDPVNLFCVRRQTCTLHGTCVPHIFLLFRLTSLACNTTVSVFGGRRRGHDYDQDLG
jgi:hypothetical protein